MAKPIAPKISQRGARGIQSLIFLASFILSAFLGLGSLSVSRVVAFRAKLQADGQSLWSFYVSVHGMLTLVPLDLMLLVYTSFVILVVVTLRVLVEAQLSIEENPERAQALAGKAERYIESALYGVVFFIIFEFTTALTSLQILVQDNVWPGIGICIIATLSTRLVIRKVAHI
ncbi:MAG: hypothetical protein ABSF09_09040 [Candidatus Bathyarchaeia archaeon]|jgi:hypothetical protein